MPRRTTQAVQAPSVCPACSMKRQLFRRGLCRRCYFDPAVRDQHAPVYRSGSSSLLLVADVPPVPALATSAWPGSVRKQHIMACRLRQGEALFHPEDHVLACPLSEHQADKLIEVLDWILEGQAVQTEILAATEEEAGNGQNTAADQTHH